MTLYQTDRTKVMVMRYPDSLFNVRFYRRFGRFSITVNFHKLSFYIYHG